MTRKQKTKKSKELCKPLNKKKFKKSLDDVYLYEGHPNAIYQKSWNLFIKDITNLNEEEKKKLSKNLTYINNFSVNHIPLAETQEEGVLRSTVVEMTNDLIETYKCGNTLEKSLCEVIANNYGKVMQISKKLTTCMAAADYLSDERTKWMRMLSKEHDRANRNYHASMNNLLDIKRPQMTINIKTNNAYMGQNQQFNTNQKDLGNH